MSKYNWTYLSDKTFAFVSSKHTLKPTGYLQYWVKKKVREYGQQIGITETPNTVFTRKEVLGMPKEFTAGRRTVTHKYFGICFCRAKTILINVKKYTSYEDLKHTIVHELVHYRFRYLKHGTTFESRISAIQRGKRYKVKLLYPENPPLSSSYGQDRGNTLQHIHRQESYCRHMSGFDLESGIWIVNHMGMSSEK
jgi:hypothetical protein